jgi:putative ABC transport system permease protein
MWNRLRSSIRAAFTRSDIERELDDEIRDHIERDIADRMRRGIDAREAHRQAVADLGGIDAVHEQLRDEHGISMLEDLGRDVRFAARRLRRNPRYAVLIILTIALGIGAATSVFSAVDGVLFKPLALAEPENIVTVWQTRPADGIDRDDFPPGTWLEVRQRASTFSHVAAANPFGVNLTDGSTTEHAEAWLVSEDFLQMLGVQPLLGRLFEARDFVAGAAPVALLDHGFWQRRFGGDPDIVGKTLRIDGTLTEVIGVMPRAFELPQPASMWRPWILDDSQRQDRFATYIRVIARLAPGVTLAQAQSELNGIAAALEREQPRSNTGVGFAAVRLEDYLIGTRRPLLYTLLAAAGILLLVALANVAALHFTRLTRQRRETNLRAMLGARGAQLVRPLVAEAALLAVLGGLVGLALGWAGVRVLHALGPVDLPRLADIRLDWRAAAVAAALAIVAAIVLALLPLWRMAHDSSTRTVVGHRQASRGRRATVGAQIALGLVLLIGTALLARSFMRVLSADRGYQSENVLSFTVWVYDEYPDGARRLQFVQQVLDRLSALPGVQSAAMGSAVPMADEITGETADIIPPGSAAIPGEERAARGTVVWSTYFATLGMRLRSGREFATTDDGRSAPAVIVNEAFVRRFFEGQDPVGHEVTVGLMGRPIKRLVVGVVGDTRHARLDAEPEPAVFIPWTQMPLASLTFVMRTTVDAGTLIPAVTRTLYEVDPRVGIARTATLESLLDQRLRERRFLLVLLTAFALCAVLISAVGVFGVMSQAAAERGREIAVRMALGAAPRTILGEFIAEAGWMTAAGLVAGLAVALAATRMLTRFLYQVAPFDPLSVTAAIAIVVILALFAAFLPGWRAAKTDPARVLADGSN